MLLSIIAVSFVIELFLVAPPGGAVMKGFVPTITGDSVYAAVGILGVRARKYMIRSINNALRLLLCLTIFSYTLRLFNPDVSKLLSQ